MPETIDAVKHHDDSCSTHASAFASWIAMKTKENDARKALMTGSKEQNSAYIDQCLNDRCRATIVVVDDEPHIAVTLSEILERRGYLTVWFAQPVAALALMEAYKPDLLLTDFTMPILDGLALACRVKVMYPDCPVLMVSAIGNDPQITHRIAASGFAVAVEAKPVQICRLLSRISDLIWPEVDAVSTESLELPSPR